MSTRIIRVQPLVLHLCIGRLLHLQTFTFAHWQTFASADLHFSTFLNTYFLWEMWPIHVIAKVWNVCYSQVYRIATWVDCILKITNRQILKQHGSNSFFSCHLEGKSFVFFNSRNLWDLKMQWSENCEKLGCSFCLTTEKILWYLCRAQS